MTNKDVSRQLKLLGQLMELHGENPFKTKSYANASFQVGRYPKPLIESSIEEIAKIPGVGKGMVQKILDALDDGSISDLDDYITATPTGVLEMLDIKGLGASKVKLLWHKYEIDSVPKLLQACEQDKLLSIKGFSEKTQTKIKEAIHFKNANVGKMLYAEALALASNIASEIQAMHPEPDAVFFSGELYRKDQIINTISFLVYEPSTPTTQEEIEELIQQMKGVIHLEVSFINPSQLQYALLVNGATKTHLDQLKLEDADQELSQEQIYQKNGYKPVIPEMQNGLSEFEWQKKYHNDQLITFDQLKGAVHNHSKYSDGQNTIEEMAQACKEMGLSYFGISDHSKTASYANGLSVKRLEQQWKEVDALNAKDPNFHIFKGIESDILMDGSLDYDHEVMSKFDFVVASIHSVLNMSEEKATQRLIKAIEHPATNILGHLSGRLLLRRPAYPLDYPKIIEACIANKVAIEINANPWRLDIDWTYVYNAMEKGAYFSINPDAHKIEGLSDMQYGVWAARKAGLLKERVINTFTVELIRKFFNKQ